MQKKLLGKSIALLTCCSIKSSPTALIMFPKLIVTKGSAQLLGTTIFLQEKIQARALQGLVSMNIYLRTIVITV